MPRNFDPMRNVPITDNEAETALRYGKDELFGSSLVGIFQCRRAMGQTLLEAYEAALMAAIGETQEVPSA
jgi:hypothetical protein